MGSRWAPHALASSCGDSGAAQREVTQLLAWMRMGMQENAPLRGQPDLQRVGIHQAELRAAILPLARPEVKLLLRRIRTPPGLRLRQKTTALQRDGNSADTT